MTIRNRIKELRRVPASSLLPNPKNWRMHPEKQHNAIREVLAEIGLANACIARELPDGSLMLLDGHLRAEVIAEEDVPVLILDVDEEEADKILATFDPISELAKTNAEQFARLSGYEPTPDELSEEPDEEDLAEQQHESRFVQLFFDHDNIEEFHTLYETLRSRYDSADITETVFLAVTREADL